MTRKFPPRGVLAVALAAVLAACPAGTPTGAGVKGADAERRAALKGKDKDKGGPATTRPDATPKPGASGGTPITPGTEPPIALGGTPAPTPTPTGTADPAGTPAPFATATPAGATPEPTPAPVLVATPTPTPPVIPIATPSPVVGFDPKALSVANQALLTKIESNLLAISRVSFSQAQSGLLSNNGSSLLGNNGAAVISNNGSALLGNNGSGYRLKQLAPLVIANDPSPPEVLFQRRLWSDGSKTIQYRDGGTSNGDLLIRRIQFDPAGVAFDEFRQNQLRPASAGVGEMARKRRITYFPNGAFSATYNYLEDGYGDGQLKLTFEDDQALFMDADAKTRVRIPAYAIDTKTGLGSFRYVFDHIGLEEAGTLAKVALNNGKLNLNFSDPMTFYDGASTVKNVSDGKLRFAKTQVTEGGVVKRTYDLGEGATMALTRVDGGRYDGDLKDGLRNVGTVRMTLLGNGTTVFDIRFLEATLTPYRIGFGEIPPDGATPAPAATPAPRTQTVAGSDTAGYAEGVGTAAQFNDLRAIAAPAGRTGFYYLADAGNHRVRTLTFDQAAQTWTTAAFVGDGTAGSADGTGAAARFQRPGGLALDPAGNLYVADTDNHRIRKVTPAGVVTTLAGDGTAGWADGPGALARFNKPSGLLVDGSGTVYVADTENHCIRAVAPNGAVSTPVGSRTAAYLDGALATASFKKPAGLLSDGSGGLIVADEGNNRLRLVKNNQVTTLAGDGDGTGFLQDGPALENGLPGPCALANDGLGGRLIAAGALRLLKDGEIRSLAGQFTTSGATTDDGFKDVKFAGIRGVVGGFNKAALVVDRHEVRFVRWP